MNFQILIGLILTIFPIIELRGGLPIVIESVVREGLPLWPYVSIVFLLNIFIIFPIFFFLDFFHESFMKVRIYREVIGKFVLKAHKKAEKIQKGVGGWGSYLALVLLVAVPLPGTGAWTGTLVAWILGLDRKKSFLAIALGIIVAGLIILSLSLGFFGVLY